MEDSSLRTALIGLDAGMHVGHITTQEPRTCAPNQEVVAVLSDPDLMDYDHIPVVQERLVVGVLVRTDPSETGLVSARMQPLSDAMLVAANMPLLEFIPLLRAHAYRLVVVGSRINGIVTWSDLLKLPVRICIFTLITHLELVMISRIRALYPDDAQWMNLLSCGRRDKVDCKLNQLRKSRSNPSKIECTEFCDKYTILAERYEAQYDRFMIELKAIQNLRDNIAHATSYVQGRSELTKFIDTLAATRTWISRFEKS
ncbi:MAG: CBS domain-containing protein [Chloroflexota bacterium]